MLIITRAIGETFTVGDDIKVTCVDSDKIRIHIKNLPGTEPGEVVEIITLGKRYYEGNEQEAIQSTKDGELTFGIDAPKRMPIERQESKEKKPKER